MSRRFSVCGLLVVMCILVGQASAQPGDLERAVHAFAGRLAKQGFPVDTTKLKIEVKSEKEAFSDLDRQQGFFFRPSHFAGTRRVFQALGLMPEKSVEEFRRLSVKGTLGAMNAYYSADRDSLVFLDSEDRQMLEAILGREAVVIHELVHAYQDQKLDLIKWLAENRATTESGTIASLLIEGHAEIVTLGLLLDEAGKSVGDLDRDDLSDDLQKLFGGVASHVYSEGRRFMWERHAEDGWKAVEFTLKNRPSSSEQILHPEKYGKDQPRKLELPVLSKTMRLVHDDVLGELSIRKFISVSGAEEAEAWLAAAGWDGDRVQTWEGEGGAWLVAWRTVWDREEDARQFQKALSAMQGGPSVGGSKTVINGRIVDFCASSSAEIAEAAADRMRGSLAKYPPDPADAASAEAAEKAFRARQSQGPMAKGNFWVHPKVGLRVPIPKGWQVKEVRGVSVLMSGDQAFSNVNVQVLPLPEGVDIDGLLAENKAGLEQIPFLKLNRIEKVAHRGHEIVRADFQGSPPGTPMELRFLSAMFIRGDKQIVVTATTPMKRWKEDGTVLKGMLDGLELEDRKKPGKGKSSGSGKDG